MCSFTWLNRFTYWTVLAKYVMLLGYSLYAIFCDF